MQGSQAMEEEGKVAWYPLFVHARTNPNTDKLHVVVMRRNNQTRYTACSVAVWQRGSCVYAAMASIYYDRHKW